MQAKHYITDSGAPFTVDAVFSAAPAKIPRYTVWRLNAIGDQYAPMDAGDDLGVLARRYEIDLTFPCTQVIDVQRRVKGWGR